MDLATLPDDMILNHYRSKGIYPYDTRNGVYKYRTIERAKEIIISNKIYFANPEELNDVFELHPSLINLDFPDGVRRRFWARILGDACPPFFDLDSQSFQRFVEEEIKKFRSSIGIFSTARTCTNGMLWDLYGDEKKGVCLCFKHDNFISKLAVAVNYVDTPQKIDFIDSKNATLSNDLLAWFCIKHKDYTSEDEVRIIDEIRCGPTGFPKSWLSEVIFGLNTSKEDQDELIFLLKKFQYPVKKIGKISAAVWGFKVEYFSL